MRRIRDNGENETLENAQEAFDRYANQKHNRWNVKRYEENLEEKIKKVVSEIIEESFVPQGYQEKWIFDKKPRKLAKAPVYDHHSEAAHILPYEKQVYDHISWRAPAVRPGLGTHAMMRFLRNDLRRSSQKDVYFYFELDIHHYFPLMDHEILHKKIDSKFKVGKLNRFFHRVVDSYRQGAPLGIKLAQLYGMLYLADFDRMAEKFFYIIDDPEKMTYWTSRYITEWVTTASSPDERKILEKGSQYLAYRFRHFAKEGLRHYYRFVDNILILHEDKVFLRIVREITIMILVRDYRTTINSNYSIRPTWMGIRLCGYIHYHDRMFVAKNNKQELARRIHKLRKAGRKQEEIRIKLASLLGFVKHADCINLLIILGMEKSLGKIIQSRRIRPPFKGMKPEQKVNFSTIVNKCETGGGQIITLQRYTLSTIPSSLQKLRNRAWPLWRKTPTATNRRLPVSSRQKCWPSGSRK